MKAFITVVHAANIEAEIKTESTVYAPKDMVYIMPAGGSFIKMARNMYEIEKERSDWIRKYENVLQGLSYWRERALSHE